MIGKLTGLVDSHGPDHLLLDVGGVGYLVYCSPRTLAALPRPGQKASLAIEMQVREDAIRLYGFAGDHERDWFRLLQGVQGVGAKVALAILGVLSTADLSAAIAQADRLAVARAPGVGPKLAARIVAELKDKAPDGSADGETLPVAASALPRAAEDAILALVNLGYGRPQAAAAVAHGVAALGEGAATAALIRHGLKQLSM
jgi:Holliday junction DNA helicase RuvA